MPHRLLTVIRGLAMSARPGSTGARNTHPKKRGHDPRPKPLKEGCSYLPTMPKRDVFYARRNSAGITLYLEPPAGGPNSRPAVPVSFRDGTLWCEEHQRPLAACNCLDAPSPDWPSRGQNSSGIPTKREEVAV